MVWGLKWARNCNYTPINSYRLYICAHVPTHLPTSELIHPFVSSFCSPRAKVYMPAYLHKHAHKRTCSYRTYRKKSICTSFYVIGNIFTLSVNELTVFILGILVGLFLFFTLGPNSFKELLDYRFQDFFYVIGHFCFIFVYLFTYLFIN